MALFHILLAPLLFSLLAAFFNLNLFLCVSEGFLVLVGFWGFFFSVCFCGLFCPQTDFAVLSDHLSGPSGVVIFGGASLERSTALSANTPVAGILGW